MIALAGKTVYLGTLEPLEKTVYLVRHLGKTILGRQSILVVPLELDVTGPNKFGQISFRRLFPDVELPLNHYPLQSNAAA